MPRILLLSDFTSEYSRNLLKGFLRYAQTTKNNWQFLRVPLSEKDFENAEVIDRVIDTAKEWKADAIFGPGSDVSLERFSQLGIPIVAQNYTIRGEHVSNVTGDYIAVGKFAANFFLRKGYSSYAYYGTDHTVWSRERGQGYVSLLKSLGKTVTDFYEKGSSSALDSSPELVEWIKSLPKPTAIFCCSDAYALHLSEVSRQIGIRCPEDILLLGVDNDELLCQMSDPPLSSIILDVNNGGYETASRLDSIFKGEFDSTFNVVINPLSIERRKSTEGFSTQSDLVKEALYLIEDNLSISVPEILEKLCVSRRVLERKFREEMDIPIYQYILNYRLSRFVDMLLCTDKQIKELAYECGYKDYLNLARAFSKKYGTTPSLYRQSIKNNS